MKRDLKFRLWLPERKKFMFCEYIPTIGFVWATLGEELEFEEGTPQQWTGLKDSNGLLIWEEDIVKAVDDHPIYSIFKRTRYTKGQIKWLREGFSVCQSGIGSADLNEYAFCDCCPCALEVIGNRFENPELLK